MSDGLGHLVGSLERSVLELTKGIREVEKERAIADKAAAVERAELRAEMRAICVRLDHVESSDEHPVDTSLAPTSASSPEASEESSARTKVWLALAAILGGVSTWVTSLFAGGSSPGQ